LARSGENLGRSPAGQRQGTRRGSILIKDLPTAGNGAVIASAEGDSQGLPERQGRVVERNQGARESVREFVGIVEMGTVEKLTEVRRKSLHVKGVVPRRKLLVKRRAADGAAESRARGEVRHGSVAGRCGNEEIPPRINGVVPIDIERGPIHRQKVILVDVCDCRCCLKCWCAHRFFILQLSDDRRRRVESYPAQKRIDG